VSVCARGGSCGNALLPEPFPPPRRPPHVKAFFLIFSRTQPLSRGRTIRRGMEEGILRSVPEVDDPAPPKSPVEAMLDYFPLYETDNPYDRGFGLRS